MLSVDVRHHRSRPIMTGRSRPLSYASTPSVYEAASKPGKAEDDARSSCATRMSSSARRSIFVSWRIRFAAGLTGHSSLVLESLSQKTCEG